MRFRTVAGALVVAAVFLIDASESSIIHKAKLVRVTREEKTRLADGTRFDKYNEKGVELPPLPIGEEETDLNDPRIGHMDRDGGVAIPVDENGKVLKEYEYLLEPIVVDIDDNDPKKPSDSHHQVPSGTDQSKNVTFVGNTGESAKIENLSAKPELYDDLPEGFEYDDVVSEPREPLPDVPDLPKPDYTDSGETDENVKADEKELERRDQVKEVIVPSSVIQPAIVPDNVEESGRVEESDISVDIPKNRVEEEEEAVGEEEEAAVENAEKDESSSSEELTDEGIQAMAEDLGKRVLDGVMSKASEFADTETDSEGVDENSIVAGPPSEPEVPSDKIIDMEKEDSDGVELPDQELSDDELARIAAESLEPVKSDVPESPVVRGARFGPDSASHYNISLQLLLISLFSFFF